MHSSLHRDSGLSFSSDYAVCLKMFKRVTYLPGEWVTRNFTVSVWCWAQELYLVSCSTTKTILVCPEELPFSISHPPAVLLVPYGRDPCPWSFWWQYTKEKSTVLKLWCFETFLPICSLLSRGIHPFQEYRAARSNLCLGKLSIPGKDLAGVSEVVYRFSQASAEKLDR